jgi:hypothetical protein
MTQQHSPVGASGAARRRQCPASVQLEARYPEPERPAAESPNAEGDAAHWALARRLAGGQVALGEEAPNGLLLTDEMLEAVDLFCARLQQMLAPYHLWPRAGDIERTVHGPRIHPRAFGTPDYAIWLTPRRLLVADFKFGHRYVEHVGNHQLVDYVAYLLPHDVDDRLITVDAVICQPRAYHRDGPWRMWTFTASDIRADINHSSNSAHEALGDNPAQRVGPECRDCRARGACDTLRRAVGHDLDSVRGLQATDLTPDALAVQLRQLYGARDRVNALVVALEEQVYSLERGGTAVPGWRTQHSAGRERWTVPPDRVADLQALLGLPKPLTRLEAVTPAQARKAGVPDAVVAALSERPPGGVSIVADESCAEARRVFG